MLYYPVIYSHRHANLYAIIDIYRLEICRHKYIVYICNIYLNDTTKNSFSLIITYITNQLF